MEASTSELLNREPFNPTVVLETEPFVQNIPQNLSKFTRFGGLSYLAVAKANGRFSAKAKKSRTLRQTVGKIPNKMSYVKG
jgi:hypothetical protein